MSNQLDTTRDRIRTLAKTARGSAGRKGVFDAKFGISFNTYANFESGKTWPRASTLRSIEQMLNWKDGAIDEAMAAGMEPALITMAHMRGERPFSADQTVAGPLTGDQLIRLATGHMGPDELRRIAASMELGGIGPSDIES